MSVEKWKEKLWYKGIFEEIPYDSSNTDRSSKNEKSDLEDRIYLYVNFKNLKQH